MTAADDLPHPLWANVGIFFALGVLSRASQGCGDAVAGVFSTLLRACVNARIATWRMESMQVGGSTTAIFRDAHWKWVLFGAAVWSTLFWQFQTRDKMKSYVLELLLPHVWAWVCV